MFVHSAKRGMDFVTWMKCLTYFLNICIEALECWMERWYYACMHHRKCIHWESIRLFELETKSYMLMSVDVDTIKISWPVLSGYDACLRVWEREKSSFIVSMIQIASAADQEPISPGPECPWCLISTVNLGSGAQYDKWLPCHITGEYFLRC